MKNKKKLIALIVAAVLIVAAIVVVKIINNDDTALGTDRLDGSVYEESYAEYLKKYGYNGIMASDSIKVDLSKYVAKNNMSAAYADNMLSTGDEGQVTFTFTVKEEGFYNLMVTYLPIEGTTSDIQRRILIDGEQPYDALSQILFKRLYQDDDILVKNDNEIRPSAQEIFRLSTVYIEDYNRRNGEPLIFFLSKGQHTVTFESAKEKMALASVTFATQEKAAAYKDVIDSLKGVYNTYSGAVLKGEAERKDGITTAILKSSSSININKNYSDADLSPYHPYHIVYNTIGGDSYKISGNYIIWELEVPETGLYEITFKGRQSQNRGVTSYRRIYINDVIPYEELNAYPFEYRADMVNYTLSDKEGQHMLFLLNKGKNELKMEVVLGEFGSVVTEVEEALFNLNQLYLKTTQITGTVPSTYIDYEIRKKVPGFVETMIRESERLTACCNELINITGEKGENTSLLSKMALEAIELSKDPEDVVDELSQWKNNISALATWMVQINEMPLEIDSIYLAGSNAKLPKPTANWFKNFGYGIYRFFASFFVKTNEVSSDSTASKGDDTLVVWMVSAGKEQAQILQNMIDESFTPNHDINVKLQLIPADVILRAALTGNGPDVVVGLSQATLADFAMRNALVDLGKYPDFKTEADRFYESAITGAKYLDGIYGLPEQQNFMMMFYRNDILTEIEADVPKTWDEIRDLIPILQKNNYDFYMPTTPLYAPMVYQYGGDYYKGSGKDYGIASGLSDTVALEAFKELTDFFTCYKLLVSADFNNRFRTGEMPIGITNYTTYCTFEVFAPEIKGLWSFAPFPGTLKEDGTIDNTFVTDTVQSVIMSASDKQDKAWTFLKWWTGSEAQLTYATTVEAVMGTAARYAAADKKVLASLPWSATEYKALSSQLEHTVGIPAVPGSYMTGRMLGYAFDNVVANSSNPRETLYLNVKAINKELLKKRAEFGID